MKRTIQSVFLLIILILILSSCSNSPGDKKTGKGLDGTMGTTTTSLDTDGTQPVSAENESTSEITNEIKNEITSETKLEDAIDGNKPVIDGTGETTDALNTPSLEKISRKEAGLSSIAIIDFSKFNINSRIEGLLSETVKYENRDYKNGIIKDLGYILCERFTDNIIDDVKIGSNIEYVKKILGKPSITRDDYIFYKTRDYYLGFKGSSKVEYAIFTNRSSGYNKDIIKLIIEQLSSNNLMDTVENNKELKAFFDRSGHIHGGGWYSYSSSGIAIEEFVDNSFAVYNNFEGDLYKTKNFNYEIVYKDSDYEVDTAISSVNSFIADNIEFNDSGVLSPSGKLKSKFFWGNSDYHVFTIRTLDNSKPDMIIGAPAGDYWWLSDDYILYLNAWTTAPYILKVSDEVSITDMNVLYNLGVFKADDYFQDFSFDINVKSINANTITLFDKEGNKEYKVEYSFDNDGHILLKRV